MNVNRCVATDLETAVIRKKAYDAMLLFIYLLPHLQVIWYTEKVSHDMVPDVWKRGTTEMRYDQKFEKKKCLDWKQKRIKTSEKKWCHREYYARSGKFCSGCNTAKSTATFLEWLKVRGANILFVAQHPSVETRPFCDCVLSTILKISLKFCTNLSRKLDGWLSLPPFHWMD